METCTKCGERKLVCCQVYHSVCNPEVVFSSFCSNCCTCECHKTEEKEEEKMCACELRGAFFSGYKGIIAMIRGKKNSKRC